MREGALPSADPRLRLLEVLRTGGRPYAVVQLADASELTPATVRYHLARLERDGLVRREPERPTGRGRPRLVYRLTAGTEGFGPGAAVVPEPGVYRGFTRALAEAATDRSAADPRTAARAAGRAWARRVMADGEVEPGDGTAQDRAIAVATRAGFRPLPDGPEGGVGQVRFRECPVLDVALQFPHIVCMIHEGRLDELCGSAVDVRIRPFCAPGVCAAEFHNVSVAESVDVVGSADGAESVVGDSAG